MPPGAMQTTTAQGPQEGTGNYAERQDLAKGEPTQLTA